MPFLKVIRDLAENVPGMIRHCGAIGTFRQMALLDFGYRRAGIRLA